MVFDNTSRTRTALALAILTVVALTAGCGPRVPAGGGDNNVAAPPKQSSPPAVTPVTPSAAVDTSALGALPDQVQFTEITKEVGINFTHFSGARGKKYMPEIETPGCAFFDYDGDGLPDILLLNGADWPDVKTGRKNSLVKLYHNEGHCRFKDVTARSGLAIEMHTMGVATGDYDNDGKVDLYITCVYGPSRLFHNDGNGHFTDVTKAAGVDNGSKWGSGAAWVDYDKDGKLDLVVGNYCKWTPATDVHCSVYKGLKSYCTPNVYDGESVRLYHNDGGGKFSDVSVKAGLVNKPGKTWGVMLLDYDDDGWMDIALANDMEPNCLFHNERNGTFKEVGLESGIALGDNGTAKAGMGIDAGDIDNSGRPSLLVSNFTGEGLSLFHNEGAGQFLESSHAWKIADISVLRMGWGLFFFDYDLDGRLDALAGNGHLYENVHSFQPDVTFKEPPLLLHNEGSHFVDVAETHGTAVSQSMVVRGSAFADIDGDGDLDVLLAENDGPVHLLRNDGGNKNHWLRVVTIGSKSNRDGIGAKVVVEAKEVKQTRWVKTSVSFLSSSELPVTFGLGQATAADRMTVTWPSGKVTIMNAVKADQVVTCREDAAQ